MLVYVRIFRDCTFQVKSEDSRINQHRASCIMFVFVVVVVVVVFSVGGVWTMARKKREFEMNPLVSFWNDCTFHSKMIPKDSFQTLFSCVSLKNNDNNNKNKHMHSHTHIFVA